MNRVERPLEVALVHHGYDSPPRDDTQRLVHDVAAGLLARGHRPTVLAAHLAAPRRSAWEGIPVVHVPRLPERSLSRRGFTGPLTQVPLILQALLRGSYDIVHAFAPPDALAGRLWLRGRGLPVVFTCPETLGRASLSSRRLQLPLLAAAIEESDRLLVPNEDARAAIARWFAAEALVIHPGDGTAHERVYTDLLAHGQA